MLNFRPILMLKWSKLELLGNKLCAQLLLNDCKKEVKNKTLIKI